MLQPDYIKLQGQSYRVEVNMSAAERFEKESGMSLSKFEIAAAKHAVDGKSLNMAIIMFWLHAAIIEGAILEGKPLQLTIEKLYQMVRPHNLSKFMGILVQQYMGENSGDDAATPAKKKQKPTHPKKRKRFFRLFRFGR